MPVLVLRARVAPTIGRPFRHRPVGPTIVMFIDTP
jgi:hypothetical protein